jgi:hypothetical protein
VLWVAGITSVSRHTWLRGQTLYTGSEIPT